MTRYRLYEIEPCALYGDCQCPPQRVVRCEGCTGDGTREGRTEVVVERSGVFTHPDEVTVVYEDDPTAEDDGWTEMFMEVPDE